MINDGLSRLLLLKFTRAIKKVRLSSCHPLLPADHTLSKREKYWTPLSEHDFCDDQNSFAARTHS